MVVKELSKEDGDINNLKRSKSRQNDIDINSFIDFINNCFSDLKIVNYCDTNENKKELITRWQENIDNIRFFSPGNVMSNIDFSFHGIYNYEDSDISDNSKVSIKKSGVIELYDLTDNINKDIKYKIPRYSVKGKSEIDLQLGFNYFYIESDGKLNKFSQVNMNEDYSYDQLILKCDDIKSNLNAIRTIRDKYDIENESYIQNLICKDVLFVYNFNRMLYKTNTRFNRRINRIFNSKLESIETDYITYYNSTLKDKDKITNSDLKDAAKVLYEIEKENAFSSYKDLVRFNINSLIKSESGASYFQKGVYIITSCRVGDPTDETYSTNNRIFADTWKELIEFL